MSIESTVRDAVNIVNPAPDFQLIETMRWEPLSGILRLPLHLARLENSANALGFACDIADIKERLDKTGRGDQPLKIRMTLAPDGAVEVTSSEFQPLPVQTVWRVAVASTRLDSHNPLLRHKTTKRQAYVTAREEYSPQEIDEVILLNERDEVCEGTITSIFLDRGQTACVTPALECGLLDGVMRRELLNKGIVQEEVITLEDLRNAKNILLGNSLRGMIRAQLIFS